jgi:alpha-mannosidase
VHDDRVVIEGRIRRQLHERLMPQMYAATMPMSVTAWDVDGEPAPFADAVHAFANGAAAGVRDIHIGDHWGRPWGTTWFQCRGQIPPTWSDLPFDRFDVEAVIDLGFHQDAAGFQSEGLVYSPTGEPLQGIHPRRMAVPRRLLDTTSAGDVAPTPGAPPGPDSTVTSGRDHDLSLLIEAASNPAIPQFAPTPLGRLATAPTRPLYRLKQASLCLRDIDVFHLLLDAEVLFELMLALPTDDPRRRRLLRQLDDAVDAIQIGSVTQARAHLAAPLRQRARASALNVVGVGHAHIDSAWLWPIRETMRKCARTFASATQLMDDYPEYVFVCSQAAQYEWIEQQHPALFERIGERVQRGQWQPVGGMWVEPDMNLAGGESIVRQLVHGQRYFEQRFGVRCREVWIPDVFGYPGSLPQIFAAGGCTRFVTQKLSWNKTNRFPHSTFWWQGIDGTRVLTHFPPVDTYNATVSSAELVYSQGNFRDSGWSDWALMPYGHGNGGGGPTREMLERARRFAGTPTGVGLDGAPNVQLATTDRFFDEVEAEIAAGAPAPVWAGELYFETHRGTLTSQARTKVGNRRCERLLREAELWWASVGDCPPDVAAQLDRLWKDTLLLQFHDILPGSSIGWVHDDAEAEFTRIANDLEALIAAALAGVSAAVSPAPSDRSSDDTVVIANAGAFARREVVEVPAPASNSNGGRAEHQLRLVDVPGSGVARVSTVAESDASDASDSSDSSGVDPVVVTEQSISNGLVALRWDLDGRVASIIDVRAGRELLPPSSAAGLTLAVDQPVEYDAWDLEAWTVADATPVVESDTVIIASAHSLRAQLQVRQRLGTASSATLTWTVSAGSPRIDIDVDVEWHERERHLCFEVPLDVHARSARCGIQFGWVDRPTHASTSWDAAKFEVAAHEWVDISEPRFGVAVLNDGRYGHGVHAVTSADASRDGRGGGQHIRVSLLRGARYPDPDADLGRHSTRLAILPHDGGLQSVLHHAEAINMPLRVIRPGDLSASARPPSSETAPVTGGSSRVVTVTHPGVRISAVKRADDGSGDLVVRLYEACGDRATTTISTARRLSAAARCNLLEEPLADGSLDVADGIVDIALRPFELVTLRLRAA